MTEQELRERIARIVDSAIERAENAHHGLLTNGKKTSYPNTSAIVTQIHALYKEAGWIDPEVVVKADLFHQWAIAKGYVKLAERDDPINFLPNALEYADGYLEGGGQIASFQTEQAFFKGCVAQRYRDLEQGWRKVILEK